MINVATGKYFIESEGKIIGKITIAKAGGKRKFVNFKINITIIKSIKPMINQLSR